MAKHKWEWLLVSPGVMALSGTPFQIRVEYRTYILYGQQVTDRIFSSYDGENKLASDLTLGMAKMATEWKANDLVEMGLVDID